MMADREPGPASYVLVMVMPVNPAASSKSRYCTWVRVMQQPTAARLRPAARAILILILRWGAYMGA
jgi:hypothetical protein